MSAAMSDAERLKELAHEAEAAESAGDLTSALAAWDEALELVPPGTHEYEMISARVADLAQQVEELEPPHPTAKAPESDAHGGWARAGAAGAGTIGLLLWKSKFALFLLLKGAKFLILGLTK